MTLDERIKKIETFMREANERNLAQRVAELEKSHGSILDILQVLFGKFPLKTRKR
jgi:hypothetical protein